MVGGNVELPRLEVTAAASAVKLLEVEHVTARDQHGVARLNDVSFTLAVGEILGVAGVDGNGQQELAEAIVGLRPIDSGRIGIGGFDVTVRPVAARLAAGLSHIPEDRHRAIFSMSITDNVVAEIVGTEAVSRHGIIDRRKAAEIGAKVVADYDVRTSGIAQHIGELSGGNQQKVVLGRALLRDPKVVVAVQPTRGLDIGATSFLQRRLLERRAAGWCTADLDGTRGTAGAGRSDHRDVPRRHHRYAGAERNHHRTARADDGG